MEPGRSLTMSRELLMLISAVYMVLTVAWCSSATTVALAPDSQPAVDSTTSGAVESTHSVRGAIVLSRASRDWMSQQIEEPCILPNPKVPERLIIFYGLSPRPTESWRPSARL